jgi:hypothetical protein
VTVARGDHFVVAARPAGLDHRGYARGCRGVDRIVERKERV